MNIWEFIGEFLDSVFNIDNKFFKTTFHLFVPAKLTKSFFSGIRQKYHHPLRIYFLSVLLLFFVLSLLQIEDKVLENLTQIGSEVINLENQKENIRKILNEEKSLHNNKQNSAIVDSIYNHLYFISNNDTLYVKDTLNTISRSIGLFSQSVELTSEEMFTKDPEDVIKEHNITIWYEAFAMRQILRMSRNIDSLGKYIFANLTWLFLALIPVFALILKLFYIRRKRFFVEHYVFLLHLFAAIILAASFLLIIAYFTGWNHYILTLILAFGVLFPFVAFVKYYQQSWVKTFFKFIFIGLMFSMALACCILLFGIVAMAFF